MNTDEAVALDGLQDSNNIDSSAEEVKVVNPPDGPGLLLINEEAICPQARSTEIVTSTQYRPPKQVSRSQIPRGQEWRADEDSQQDIGRLNEVIRQHRSSILGLFPDDERKLFVLVIDGSSCMIGKIARLLRNKSLGIDIELRKSCRSLDLLNQAHDFVSDREWIADEVELSLFSFLDPKLQQISVGLAVYEPPTCGTSARKLDREKSRAVANHLAKELGGVGRVYVSDPKRHSRTSDENPHKGGAKIRSRWDDPPCTAGFVARRLGREGVVTAGHCFNTGDKIVSGPFEYGTVVARAEFPKYDMEFVEARDGENFDPRFYISDRSTLIQSSVSDADLGAYICISGQRSGQFCRVTVINDSGRFCDEKKDCTDNLWMARKVGSTITRKGDSGATVYERTSQTEASVVGMSIGDPGRKQFSLGGDTIAFHSWRQIRDVLGAEPALNN